VVVAAHVVVGFVGNVVVVVPDFVVDVVRVSVGVVGVVGVGVYAGHLLYCRLPIADHLQCMNINMNDRIVLEY
jgi:hypothetical protein